ncbi:MAG: tetratricopeptide repeat protein [Candidatus Saliniplasma sp.]
MRSCIRCEKNIEELYLICTECAKDLFSENIFWIASSPTIHEPVIDRYKEDSEAFLRVGDVPDDELEFRKGDDTLKEIGNVDIENLGSEGYVRVQKRFNTILAEMGVTNNFDPDKYVFSDKDVKVFSEIFYLVEEMEHKFAKHKGRAKLYLKIGNLFFYTGLNTDSSAFEMQFRNKVKRDLLREADGYYSLAIENSEGEVLPQYNKGLLHLERGEISDSKERFETVLDSEPDNFPAKIGLIRSLIKFDRLDEAEDELNSLLEEYDSEKEIWFLKGEIARLKDRWGGAIQFYNQCLKIDFKFEDALTHKCEILLDRGMYSQANNAFDEYIKEEKYNPEVWFGKARALYYMDKWGGAIQCINEALVLDPQIKEAWVTKGDIFADKKQYDLAIDSYENALKIDPVYENAKEKLEKTRGKLEGS